MASAASIRRIIWLLRMAKNQEGTPAGQTYAAKAKELQERNGIEITLDDTIAMTEQDERPTALVGHYEQRDLWRDCLVGCIQTVYGVEFAWNYSGNLIELRFRDPEDHRDHLNAAVEMYLRLEHVIEYYRFLVPPVWTRMLPHDDCVRMFRAGLANGIYMTLRDARVERPMLVLGERPEADLVRELEDLRRELESTRWNAERKRISVEIAKLESELEVRRAAANDPSCTALVPLRKLSATTGIDPEQEPQREEGIPRDREIPDMQTQSFEAQIFNYAMQIGNRLQLPELIKAKRAS